MTKEELKHRLQQPYDQANWIEIISAIFIDVDIFQSPLDIPNTTDGVEEYRQLGNVRLDGGKNLALFEIRIGNQADLRRAKVKYRNLIIRLIDQDKYHGVLAVFYSHAQDFRFTFAAKDSEFSDEMELVTRQTEPKRFTYVLGPNETCTTAVARFHFLAEQGAAVALKHVIDAFSVEKLNKEFFAQYKEQYELFVEFITGVRYVKKGKKWEPKKTKEPHASIATVFNGDQKHARDFVKRLLGRIVFLHFLQKKGWLGCPADSTQWNDGDPAFLKNFYYDADDKEHFHSEYLSPLFFGALNTPDRPNDIFEPTGNRIPYLNGGLFEEDLKPGQSIDFPSRYFESLTDFFGQYNFTIDENDPNDHEVGIDPEMLGHIFENLLEDNKDKGAYYTPKPIVQYMCQESLLQYLITGLEAAGTTIDDSAEDALSIFIRYDDAGDPKDKKNFVHANAARIEDLLDEVKICDPAIGSGAFPLDLLKIIYHAKMSLDWTLDPASVKKTIIQNSIYGVDIEKGAVDIARLRLWLALLVDEEEPQPLPNLDYKIMQGNSLLESFEGVDLKFEHQPTNNTIV